jgi:hypothetical protein
MRRNLTVLLVGVLIGGLLFLAAPSPAGPVDRIRKLERQVATLKKQVATLKNKTRNLTRQGFYTNFVGGSQVLSDCDVDATATWTNDIGGVTELDVCTDPAALRSGLRDR